jgi:hypothetical protein
MESYRDSCMIRFGNVQSIQNPAKIPILGYLEIASGTAIVSKLTCPHCELFRAVRSFYSALGWAAVL